MVFGHELFATILSIDTDTPAAIGALPDIVGLLVATNLEAVTALLDRKIAAEARDDHALTPEQRQTQTAQAMASLFAVEVDEATLTFQAWQDGLPVDANVKINPAALLALRNVVDVPANPSPGSSPWHAFDVVGPL